MQHLFELIFEVSAAAKPPPKPQKIASAESGIKLQTKYKKVFEKFLKIVKSPFCDMRAIIYN
ncbi:hypothetical protein ATE47_07595 [Chryseobacterium sp. IHB B 17019]|nr:hypothetical protein ATE47_07595 [Chryseobacterium sp. IHB B 17019]